MNLKKIDLNKLQDYAFTANEIVIRNPAMASNSKFINIKCLDNEGIAPTVKAIPIPEDATNGDVLKAIFNPCRIIKYTSDVQVYFSERYYQFFGMSWWNAKYKGVEE